MSLITKVKTAFHKQFPETSESIRLFQAPGRVNLIGEHTDYNDGFVLPVAIDFQTVVAASLREDSEIHIYAVDKTQQDVFDLNQAIKPALKKRWANYTRGMAKILQEDGKALRGMNLAVAGNVPIASGLSSSASLEMAIGCAYLSLSQHDIDKVALALSGQKTENHFVGVQCGIMDQYISALGRENHALLIDCRDLSYQTVPVPPDTAIIIVDSGVKRGLLDSEYNARREECEAGAAHFGVKALRDVDQIMLEAEAENLASITYKRTRHVITENARTLDSVLALKDGDMAALGPLMAQSHQSMRDDFEITVPAIDTLVDIMKSVPGVYGARMTGGGFGGCCVALAPRDIAPLVKKAVAEQYTPQTRHKAKFYVCQASTGAGELT